MPSALSGPLLTMAEKQPDTRFQAGHFEEARLHPRPRTPKRLHLLPLWRERPLDPALPHQRQSRVRQPPSREADDRHSEVIPQDSGQVRAAGAGGQLQGPVGHHGEFPTATLSLRNRTRPRGRNSKPRPRREQPPRRSPRWQTKNFRRGAWSARSTRSCS